MGWYEDTKKNAAVVADPLGVFNKDRNEKAKESLGITDRKSGELAKEQESANVRQADETKGVLDRMTASEGEYQERRDPYVNTYVAEQEKLKGQAEGQATDARQTYSNTIQPEMKNLMEMEKANSQGALTMAEANDPNNRIAQGVRNMYNTQAQGEGKAGLASSGVLANLGAQAFGNQMGAGGPMTGGQMQMLAAQSQQQGADAYARTQQRMAGLQDQGIERGFGETEKAYGRGLEARDRYRGSVGDIEGAEDRYHSGQAGFRNEVGNRAGDIMGTEVGRAGEDLGLAGGQHQRDLGAIDQRYGNESSARAAEQQSSAARQAGRLGMTTGLIQTGATVAGGMVGGPAGAQAGAAVGGGIGRAMSDNAPSQQQPNMQGVAPQQQGYGTLNDPTRRPQAYGGGTGSYAMA